MYMNKSNQTYFDAVSSKCKFYSSFKSKRKKERARERETRRNTERYVIEMMKFNFHLLFL